MTMTMPASSPGPAHPASLDPILRVTVALVGAIEGINGLTDLPVLFGDVAAIPGTSPGGMTVIASIILHPILGFAALGFALTQRLRRAIAALAFLALAQWASGMPSVIRHGVELTGDTFVVGIMAFKVIIQPAIALLAISAASFNRHLAAATVGVISPTLVNAAAIAAFATAVFMHGF